MVNVQYSQGLHLPGANLWLDPRWKKDFAFVSHAHSDHTGRHDRIFSTRETACLTSARTGLPMEAFLTASYGERVDFGHWRGTLIPAGHVLGSAQLLFESAEGTLLYTGDFKLRHGLSSEPAKSVPAETLVMETTYGLPKYHFPSTEECIRRIRKFCMEVLEDGEVPVLLGYSLGKAQEILSAIAGGGWPIMLHGSVAKMSEIYSDCGVTLPPFVPWDPKTADGHVLVCPPSAGSALRKIKNKRVAAVTGWAMDSGSIHRLGVDVAIPLSDHADYSELLAHVEAVAPKRVLTLHGFAQEFARDLRGRGIEAWALTGPNQMEWDLLTPRISMANSETPELPPASGFDGLARVCELIRQSSGKLEKIRLLSDYLSGLPREELPFAAVWLTGRPFAPSDPRVLQTGSAILRKALASATRRPETEVRGIARRNNDFGMTTAELLADQPGPRTSRTIQQMALIFEAIAAEGSPQNKCSLLASAYRGLHPLTAKTLSGILLGDLRIGLKEGLLEDALAAAFDADPAALRETNMLTGDIGETAKLAASHTLRNAGLELFRPLKCMLASPEPDAESVWERLGNEGVVWLEDKLDGIRAQIHCSPAKTRIFSRDLKDITESFPEIAKAACGLGILGVIDGELLAWEDGRPLPFHQLQHRLGRTDGDLFLPQRVPVAFLAFDLLYLRGFTLIREPLRERRRHLDSLRWQDPLFPAPVLTASSPAEIDAAFDAARARGNEGLLAKDPTSPYRPGRRGLSWIKLKKQFATLDVVVTAAEYGHGKRREVLSDYTFSVRHGDHFLPIGKAYSGLTDGEIEELTAEFLGLVTHRDGNRLEVEPKVVLEIAFDAIQPSDRHASGLALRFPRINRIRRDKTPGEIDTLARAKKLLKN